MPRIWTVIRLTMRRQRRIHSCCSTQCLGVNQFCCTKCRDIRERKDPMFSRRSSVAQAIICALLTALGSFASNGCNRPSNAPVTISFLDPEWSNLESYRSKPVREALLDFTRQTGIQVKHIPAPEDSREQLKLMRRLLGMGSAGPDVYVIDVVWPGILSKDLLDLGNQFSDELKSRDPYLLDY